jgi:GT2 family glycosyltransferase
MSVGNLDGVIEGIAFGWVTQNRGRQLPIVEALIGGVVLARAELLGRRYDIEDLGLAENAYSFKIDLKPLLKICQEESRVISIINLSMAQPLPGSPFCFAKKILWGHCAPLSGRELQGWASVTDFSGESPTALQLWLDGKCIDEQLANRPRPDFTKLGLRFARCGFRFQIPAYYLDGQSHTLSVRPRDCYPSIHFGGSEQSFQYTLRHKIRFANNSFISGRSYLEEAPTIPLVLEAIENGRKIGESTGIAFVDNLSESLQADSGCCRADFKIAISPSLEPDRPRRIRVHLSGDRAPIEQKEILIESRSNLIQLAQATAAQNETFRWWMRGLVEKLRYSETDDDSLFKVIPITALDHTENLIDIIVPVYKGRKETLACLHSLLATPDSTPFTIIIINDASPDAQLTDDLRKMAEQESRIKLLENKVNLGFVATVNRGMALHPERDVLLLNADTLLPATNWLLRLRTAAYHQPRVATVTPFSNSATICSLPLPNVDNDMPPGHSVTSVDAICSQTNPGLAVDIPTAVGFCMYIRRAALDEIGLFDAERWGKGYGEENDFCLKAASLGWRHLAACDVFVQHHGSVSFQSEKISRIQANLARLNSLYPDYPTTIQRYLYRDPLAAARNRVALQLYNSTRGKKKAKGQTLHIMHAWGGGIQHHVDQRCTKSGYILRPTRDGQAELLHPSTGLAMRLPLIDLDGIGGSSTGSPLLDLLRQLNVNLVHVHQWIGMPPVIWNLPQALGVPFDFTVHDYYSFCPRVVMLDHTGQFCGQAPVSRCIQCLKAKPLETEISTAYQQIGGTPQIWREFHAHQLALARQLIAPSQDAAIRISKAFRFKKVVVIPHEPPLKSTPSFRPLPKSGEELRVAVIGAIGPAKGYDQLLALAQLAEHEAPNLRFFVVGYTSDDRQFDVLANVQITGRYEPHKLQSLLAELDCHLALFLSPWPETYSYALSEAFKAELRPVVIGLGALGERVSALGITNQLAPQSTAEKTLSHILQMTIE